MEIKHHRVIQITFLLVVIIVVYGIFKLFEKEKEDWDYTGYLEADVANLSFEFPGKVVEVMVKGGEHLQKGSPLVLLDTVEFHMKLKELEAKYEALEANRKALEEEIAYLKDRLERLKRIKEEAVALDKIRALETKIQQLLNKHESLLAEKRAVEVNRERIREYLSKSVLRTPSEGEVIDILVKIGEVVAPGLPVVRFGFLDTLNLYFFIPETDLHLFQPGDAVWIRTDGLKKKWFPAYVEWISQEAEFTPKFIQTRKERETLVFKIRARVPNLEGLLKAGLPVDVRRNRPSF